MDSHKLIVALCTVLSQIICFNTAEGYYCNLSGSGKYPQTCTAALSGLVSSIRYKATRGASSKGLCKKLVQNLPPTIRKCKLNVPDMIRESEGLIRQFHEAYRLFIDLRCDDLLTPPRPGCAPFIGCFEGTDSKPGIFNKYIPGIDCGKNGENYRRTTQCFLDGLPTSTTNGCSHICKNFIALRIAKSKLCPIQLPYQYGHRHYYH